MSRFLEETKKHKIIPVIAIDKAEDAIELGKVLKENGLPVAEIVLRTPAAIEAIRLMKEHHPEIYVGAGTVKNARDAIEACEAGADFIVSPATNQNTVIQCRDLGIEIITGVVTPSDIELGLELGLENFKFFPAELSGGAKMVSTLLSVYTDITLMPTGGVNPQNVDQYLSIPRVTCCGGTWFINKDMIANGQWNEIALNIRNAVSLTTRYLD